MDKQVYKILIIDDSAKDRERLRRCLEQNSDCIYEFLEAEPGGEGLRTYLEAKPDCVLLAYSFPDGDGSAVLKTINPDPLNPAFAVILLIGSGSEATALNALKNGAQDYLVKEKITAENLHLSVSKAIEVARLRQENLKIIEELRQSKELLTIGVNVAEQLRVSEERLSLAVKGANIGTFDWNIKTGEIQWSNEIEKSAAMTADEFGNSFDGLMKIIHPEDREKVRGCIEAAVTDGEYECDFRMLRGDGAIRWVIGKGKVSYDADGAPARLVGVDVDITKRKLAEEKLIENQQFMSSIIETAPSVLYTFDVKTKRNTHLTAQAAAALGYSPDELEAATDLFQTSMHPDDAIRAEKYLKEIAATRNGGVFEFEYRMLHKSGEWHWFRSRDTVFKRDDEGNTLEILGVAADISERKHLEEKIREQFEELENIYRTAPVGLALIDREFRFVRINERLAEINGFAAQEHLGRGIREIVPNIADQAEAAFRQMFATGEAILNVEIEGETAAQPGVRRIWEENWYPLKNDAGETVYISLVVEEITERKQQEEKLRASEEFNRTVFESSPDCIKILDGDGRVQFMNANGLCLMEIDDFRQFKNDFWWNLWTEETQPTIKESIKKALLGATVSFQAFSPTAKGAPKWWDVIVSPISGADGSPTQIISVSRDITERKAGQERLLEQQEIISRQFDEIEALYQSAPVGLAYVDRELRFIRINEMLAEINGVTTENTIGRTLREVLPALADEIEPLYRGVLATGEPVLNLEITGETDLQPGVRHVWVVNYYPLKNSDDEIVGVNAVVQEITERKRQEEQLRESQNRLALAMDTADIYSWEVDVVSGAAVWSENAARVLGFAPELIPQTVAEATAFNHPDDDAAARREIEKALSGGQSSFSFEQRLVNLADNSIVWILVQGTAENIVDGKPTRLVGLSQNITARKTAEAAQTYLATLVESSQDAIFGLTLDRRVTSWNPSAEKLFGYTAAEMFGQSLFKLIPEDKIAETRQVIARFNSGAEVPPYDTVRLIKDGARVDVSVALSPIRDAANEISGISVMVRDICERKLAEQEREKRLEREQELRHEAEKTNRAKDEFLAMLSHELRSPLNSMLGWTQMLQNNNLDAETSRKAVEVIARSVRLQNALIEDILDVSRIVSGKMRLESATVSFVSIIETALSAARPAAEKQGVIIESDFDVADYEVFGDRHRLQQIINNLLTNAIKFTPGGGLIKMRLRREDSRAKLIVEDSGIGIEPDLLPQIFDRFTQADASSKRKFGGLGLGLAIVKHLVELHGGTISAHSDGAGLGAAFTVLLPLAPTVLPPDDFALPAETKAGAAMKSKTLFNLRILLVDDDCDALNLMRFALESKGAKIACVESAAGALSRLEENQFDLMISDLGMAEMDGYDLIRKLRESERNNMKTLPAIALTGYVSPDDRERVLAAGFQAHLPKPVDTKSLPSVILNLLKNENAIVSQPDSDKLAD